MSKVSLCGMRRRMRKPDPHLEVTEAIPYCTVLSVVSLSRVVRPVVYACAENSLALLPYPSLISVDFRQTPKKVSLRNCKFNTLAL